jgi:hypothetical protein
MFAKRYGQYNCPRSRYRVRILRKVKLLALILAKKKASFLEYKPTPIFVLRPYKAKQARVKTWEADVATRYFLRHSADIVKG